MPATSQPIVTTPQPATPALPSSIPQLDAVTRQLPLGVIPVLLEANLPSITPAQFAALYTGLKALIAIDFAPINGTSSSGSTTSTTPASTTETVVFAENFANTSGALASLNSVGWRLWEGNGGGAAEVPGDASAIAAKVGVGVTTPINAGYTTVTNVGYFLFGTGTNAQLLLVEKTTVTAPKKVRFQVSLNGIEGSATVSTVYVAARIGNNFYVYDSPQIAPTPSAGNDNVFDNPAAFSVTLDMTTAGKWRTLVNTGPLYIGAPLAGTLPSGDVHMGVYFTSENVGGGNNGATGAMNGGRVIKMDSYEVIS